MELPPIIYTKVSVDWAGGDARIILVTHGGQPLALAQHIWKAAPFAMRATESTSLGAYLSQARLLLIEARMPDSTAGDCQEICTCSGSVIRLDIFIT